MKPSVSSISPAFAAVAARVVIAGAGFTGATAVSFGGVVVPVFNVDNDTQITATVPAGAPAGPVVVTTSQGASTGGPSFGPAPVQGQRRGGVKQVYSTLSADTRYTGWAKSAGLNTPTKGILVRGGAGIAVRGGAVRNVSTPRGVRTEVSEQDAEFLLKHPQFQEHMRNGFVRIQDNIEDPDNAAQSMAVDKGSSPKTAADVAADNAKAAREANGNADNTKPIQALTNKK